MNILFLHGWQSTPGGLKPTYLKVHGHTVLNPKLPDDDFDLSVSIAQSVYNRHQPDVVVGSSRGGAVAMNIDSKDTPLVLLCPAWKTWGTATTVKPGTVILHARADETVPFADSLELLGNSGLPPGSLIEVGTEHRLADEESLGMMVKVCERYLKGNPCRRSSDEDYPCRDRPDRCGTLRRSPIRSQCPTRAMARRGPKMVWRSARVSCRRYTFCNLPIRNRLTWATQGILPTIREKVRVSDVR